MGGEQMLKMSRNLVCLWIVCTWRNVEIFKEEKIHQQQITFSLLFKIMRLKLQLTCDGEEVFNTCGGCAPRFTGFEPASDLAFQLRNSRKKKECTGKTQARGRRMKQVRQKRSKIKRKWDTWEEESETGEEESKTGDWESETGEEEIGTGEAESETGEEWDTDGVKLIMQVRNKRLDVAEWQETRDFPSLFCF